MRPRHPVQSLAPGPLSNAKLVSSSLHREQIGCPVSSFIRDSVSSLADDTRPELFRSNLVDYQVGDVSSCGAKLESEPIIAHAQNHYKSLFFRANSGSFRGQAPVEVSKITTLGRWTSTRRCTFQS